jgi:beta-galactosidase
MGLRCNDPQYLEKVKPFYKELFDRVRPHLCTNGGRVIMVQIENEYGSYGDDTDYLRAVESIYKENGIDCLCFTSDGASMIMLSGGTLPHLLSVANFGSHPGDNFRALREFRQNEPLMCGEFWSGWFDHWYENHHVRSTEDIVNDTRELFECGASFNYYMFHGGTNFGFWNGANHTGTQYQPTITSYDYCAPLSECGDLTPTYFAIRQLIEDQTGTPAPALDVANLPKTAYTTVSLTESAPLWDNLDNLASAIHSAAPKTMEELGQDFGYILYSTTLRGPFEPLDLVLEHVHDRALVFLDGKFVGLRERSRTMDEIKLSLGVNETARLDILVENMGRVNYGPKLFDRKGVVVASVWANVTISAGKFAV